MPNLHSSGPDTLAELESWSYDLLPACIVSSTWPVAPGSGLTIAAFATSGYVRKGTLLYYVEQPARAITLPSAAGTYYLALTTDTHSTVGSFTRVPGSHYAYLASGTVPTPPDGSTLIAAAVVSGGNITSVDPAIALTPPLSRQTADAVAITGGTATLSTLSVTGLASMATFQGTTGYATQLGIAVTANYPLHVNGHTQIFGGNLGLGGALPNASPAAINLLYAANARGLDIKPTSDSGATAMIFFNQAGTIIGSISNTATTTSYNTSSDRRLKRNVQPLANALATLRQVRPVSFYWNQDDSYGEGWLADELQTVLPSAVTGTPDAVDAQGNIVPQGIDFGKVVPMLCQAVKELLAKVENLEVQLGV